MIVEAGKQYRSRRGERVLVTAVEPTGLWPVHFVVMDGPYKGVGKRDGSRLTIEGRSMAPKDGILRDHSNDLVAEWTNDAQSLPWVPAKRGPGRRPQVLYLQRQHLAAKG
jgi:hypothetical protein